MVTFKTHGFLPDSYRNRLLTGNPVLLWQHGIVVTLFNKNWFQVKIMFKSAHSLLCGCDNETLWQLFWLQIRFFIPFIGQPFCQNNSSSSLLVFENVNAYNRCTVKLNLIGKANGLFWEWANLGPSTHFINFRCSGARRIRGVYEIVRWIFAIPQQRFGDNVVQSKTWEKLWNWLMFGSRKFSVINKLNKYQLNILFCQNYLFWQQIKM